MSTAELIKGPKALFWYLTLFFSLGITAFSTGGLWFQFINNWFTKEVMYGQVVQSFSQNALKMQMASLLIAVPLYFVFTLWIRKGLRDGKLAPDNKIRTWITYFILFIVIATAAGDLITATFRVLSGDYTTRFLLKALVILVIVAWIFVYYWMELRSENTLNKSKLPLIMAVASLAVIVLSFFGTFFIIESPAEARRKAFDRTRVMHLTEIKYNLDSYYYEYKKLPDALEELKSLRGLQVQDPKSGEVYEYQATDATAYRLCAEFDGSNKEDGAANYYDYPQEGEFRHDAGRVCFDRQVPNLDTVKPVPVQ